MQQKRCLTPPVWLIISGRAQRCSASTQTCGSNSQKKACAGKERLSAVVTAWFTAAEQSASTEQWRSFQKLDVAHLLPATVRASYDHLLRDDALLTGCKAVDPHAASLETAAAVVNAFPLSPKHPHSRVHSEFDQWLGIVLQRCDLVQASSKLAPALTLELVQILCIWLPRPCFALFLHHVWSNFSFSPE